METSFFSGLVKLFSAAPVSGCSLEDDSSLGDSFSDEKNLRLWLRLSLGGTEAASEELGLELHVGGDSRRLRTMRETFLSRVRFMTLLGFKVRGLGTKVAPLFSHRPCSVCAPLQSPNVKKGTKRR